MFLDGLILRRSKFGPFSLLPFSNEVPAVRVRVEVRVWVKSRSICFHYQLKYRQTFALQLEYGFGIGFKFGFKFGYKLGLGSGLGLRSG